MPSDPTERLQRRKDEGRIVLVEDDVLKRLLELSAKRTFAGLRDCVHILLALNADIRPGEALSLIPPDINIRSREVYIRPEVTKTRTQDVT